MTEREPLLQRRSAREQHDEDDHHAPLHDMLSRQKLLGRVNTTHGDVILLTYCFVTGMLDAATFNNWTVFIAMQTGNTVIACLSSAGFPPDQPYTGYATIVSLGSFFVGALVTSQVSRCVGSTLRLTLVVNFFIQALLIVVSAILVSLYLVPIDNHNNINTVSHDIRIIAALPPLAFQSGMQIASSRLLGYGGEIPVNVLTSTYAALAADPKLLAGSNPPRNRRVAAVLLLAGGAICSAWIMKKGPGLLLVLWLAAGIKLSVAFLAGLFLDAEKADEEPAN